jgi:hypothetical protein
MAAPGVRRRRRTLIGASLAVTALAAAGITALVLDSSGVVDSPTGCLVSSSAGRYPLGLAQAANAATISAVALRQGLPDHAVTVALAAALQESQLHNLTYGDRDSVGLFQQRPSQGWGPRAELLSPQFAATQFFQHLAQVPGWQSEPVAEAAQAVQRSADGAAYESWEREARAIAEALTGETPAALTCTYSKAVSSSAGLQAAMSDQLPAMPGTTVSVKTGWTIASWLVAQAAQYDIASVTFDGKRWTHSAPRWESTGGNPSVVSYQLSH